MHQLKSIYNSPFKDSHPHSIHTCFEMIASNETPLSQLFKAADAHLHQEATLWNFHNI